MKVWVMARLRWRVRALMAIVFYIAVDCAALYNATWHGSIVWLFIFLLLTLIAPLILGLWWLFKQIDRSGHTLY